MQNDANLVLKCVFPSFMQRLMVLLAFKWNLNETEIKLKQDKQILFVLWLHFKSIKFFCTLWTMHANNFWRQTMKLVLSFFPWIFFSVFFGVVDCFIYTCHKIIIAEFHKKEANKSKSSKLLRSHYAFNAPILWIINHICHKFDNNRTFIVIEH